MRAGLQVGSVLGLGTALVFAAAALAATLFPTGTIVNQGWNGGVVPLRGEIQVMGVPLPGGALAKPGAMDGDVVIVDRLPALPGDTVGGGWTEDPAEP